MIEVAHGDVPLIALSGLWTDTEERLTLFNGGGKDWAQLFVSLQKVNRQTNAYNSFKIAHEPRIYIIIHYY